MRIPVLLRARQGFTLVEMMIVLAIAAIVLGLGMPSFNDSVRDKRLSTLTSEFISSVYVARNESLTRRRIITLQPDANGWNVGWTINDGNTVLHRFISPDQLITILAVDANNDVLNLSDLSFSPSGKVTRHVLNATGTIGSVNVMVCDSNRTTERGRTLSISPLGTLQNNVHPDSALCNP